MSIEKSIKLKPFNQGEPSNNHLLYPAKNNLNNTSLDLKAIPKQNVPNNNNNSESLTPNRMEKTVIEFINYFPFLSLGVGILLAYKIFY